MKDLSTYIAEARTLKDLKGKQVNKIEICSNNIEWHSLDVLNISKWDVTIKNPRKITDSEIEEMFVQFKENEYLKIQFLNKNKKPEWIVEFTTRECTFDQMRILIKTYINPNKILRSEIIRRDLIDFSFYIKNFIKEQF